MRFYINDDSTPRLTGLVRMAVFGTIEQPARGRRKARLVAAGWHGWNDDPVLEIACARLRGQGSFYWFGAISALTAAKRFIRDDARIHQIKLETINGQEIGRIYR